MEIELEQHSLFSKCTLFYSEGVIYHKGSEAASLNERKRIMSLYESEEIAYTTGILYGGVFFDIQRFHPPLIYGRTGTPVHGEGICVIKGKSKQYGECYLVCIYPLPILSSMAVPQAMNIFSQYVGHLESPNYLPSIEGLVPPQEPLKNH